MTWREQAACRPGTEASQLPWLDATATRQQIARMLHVCRTCPALDECRAELELCGDRVGVRAGVNWTVRGARNGDVRVARKRRACKWCGVNFAPPDRAIVCCSDVCDRRYEQHLQRKCEQCGGPMRKNARPERKYCSAFCRSKARESWAPRDPRTRTRVEPKAPATVVAIGAASQRAAERRRERAAAEAK